MRRHATAWRCRLCGQHGLSVPPAPLLGTYWAHYTRRHAVTDTTVSIFDSRTR